MEPNYDSSNTNYLDVGNLETHNVAWIIAGLCVAAACILSFHQTYRHFTNYTKPEHQKHIIRIILMVPIYGIDSLLSLRFYWISVYFDVVRDCYEAFVIYTFYSLLIEYVGGYENGKEMFAERGPFKLSVPLCCVQVKPKRGLLRQCKRLTLQYVVIRPAMTILAIILHTARSYCPGNYSPFRGYIYVTAVNFCSVTVAMYALVLFYSFAKEDIAKYKPIPKFLSVKFVIFMSFWQSIIVSAFVTIHGLRATTYWTTDNIATAVQNALLCVEMLLAAIAHHWAFSHHEFATGTRTSVLASAANAFSPSDIALDIYYSFFPHAQIRDFLLRSEKEDERMLEDVNDRPVATIQMWDSPDEEDQE